MTLERLLQLLRRRPFVPFRLHLSGGTSYDIRHPEMMLVARTAVVVAIHEPGQSEQDVPARDVLISPLHITSAEDLAQDDADALLAVLEGEPPARLGQVARPRRLELADEIDHLGDTAPAAHRARLGDNPVRDGADRDAVVVHQADVRERGGDLLQV